jgi:hypothetical protein
MAINQDNLLEALQPDPTKTSFPAPRLVVGRVDGVSYTFESFNLGGTLLPGQWLLTDATRVFGWQVQKGAGLTGATLFPTGDDPMTLKFAVKIWSNVDAALYRTLLKTLLRKPVGFVPGTTKLQASAALGIDHPGALDLGVTAVVVKSVTGLMNPLVTSGGKGAWTAAVEFLEWRTPIPAEKKPTQKTPDVAPASPTAANNVQLENVQMAAAAAAKKTLLAQRLLGGPKP